MTLRMTRAGMRYCSSCRSRSRSRSRVEAAIAPRRVVTPVGRKERPSVNEPVVDRIEPVRKAQHETADFKRLPPTVLGGFGVNR